MTQNLKTPGLRSRIFKLGRQGAALAQLGGLIKAPVFPLMSGVPRLHTNRLYERCQRKLQGCHESIENLCDGWRCRVVFQQSLKLAVVLPLSSRLVDWKRPIKKLSQVRTAGLQIVLQYLHCRARHSCFDIRNVLSADCDRSCNIGLSQTHSKTDG